MKRRDFLHTAIAAGLPLAADYFFSHPAIASEKEDTSSSPIETVEEGMIYRTLGKTGEKVSLIGLGGYHIGTLQEEKDSIALIQEAIDRGITFMDNCWDYLNGTSEIRMGKALQGKYRDKVFLMSKIDGRTKKSASQQIDESLKRLRTDHIDLMQFHEIIRLEDPDRLFNEGGAEAMLAAQKAGKIRYIGFTGHKDPLVHLRMLERVREEKYPLHAVQMPLNVMDAHFRSFATAVLPELLKDQIGVLAMKTLGSGSILKSGTVTAVECLHYAMNLPVSTVITGIESRKILLQALDAVQSFKPIDKEEVALLLKKTKEVAKKGEFERFKTSKMFDGTASNPHWLG